MAKNTRGKKSKRPTPPRRGLSIERLEDRTLPAVTPTLSGALLDVVYDADRDAATIRLVDPSTIRVTADGASTDFSAERVSAVQVRSVGGEQQSVSFEQGLALSGSLQVNGLDSVRIGPGDYSASSVAVAATGSIDVNGATIRSTGDVSLVASRTAEGERSLADLVVLGEGVARVSVIDASLSGSNVVIRAEVTVTGTAERGDQENPNRDLQLLRLTADAQATVGGRSAIEAREDVTIAAVVTETAAATATATTANTDSSFDAAFAGVEVIGTSIARAGDGARISAGDAFRLQASHTTDATSTADGTTAASAGKGAGVALAKLQNETRAALEGDATVTARTVDVTADSTATVGATAKSTSGGATGNGAATQQAIANSGATTGNGGLTIAGAFAWTDLANDVTEATISAARVSAGVVNVRAAGKATVTTNADAGAANSASGGDGFGIAIAANTGGLSTEASLAGSTSFEAPAVSVTATGDDSAFSATATSGAGSPDVDVAGAVAWNDLNNATSAAVAGSPDFNGGDLSLTADSKVSVTADARPTALTGTAKLGFGASFGVNRVDNVTAAEVRDGAAPREVKDLTLSATAKHDSTATGVIGGDGDETDADDAATAGAAVSLIDNDAAARVGTGTSLTLTGKLTLNATLDASTTSTARGDLTTKKSAFGGAVAYNEADDQALATTARNVTAAGDVSISADAQGISKAESVSSTQGAISGNANGQQQAQQNAVGSTTQTPSSQTPDGQIGASAAISVNAATVNATASVGDGTTLRSSGAVGLAAVNDAEAGAKADASRVATPTTTSTQFGVGVAVAKNDATAVNQARIGTNAIVDAADVTLKAAIIESDEGEVFGAEATSGAGGKKFVFSGAFALNRVDNRSEAVVAGGATVLSRDDVTLSALDASASTATALPTEGGTTADKLGVGGSLAHNAIANVTRAVIESGATVRPADALSVAATGEQTVTTRARGGAAGETEEAGTTKTLITPVFAISDVDNATTARTAGTVDANTVSVSVTHDGATTTAAEGSTNAAKTAIGFSLAWASVADEASASVAGDVVARGAVSILSDVEASSASTSQASAKGGDANAPDGTANAQLQQANQQASSVSGQNNAPAPQAKTGDGVVAGAAAIAYNEAKPRSLAFVDRGAVLTAGGSLNVAATGEANDSARADASAVGEGLASGGTGGSTPTDGGSLGVGVAVAINAPTATTQASIGEGATVSAVGATVEAKTTEEGHSFDVEAVSGAGARKTGFAAGFALNVVNSATDAVIASDVKTPTALDAGAADLNVRATSNTDTTAKANPTEDGVTGKKTGIGASIAFNLAAHQTRAEITDGTATDALNVNVLAVADHTATTEVVGGAGTDDEPAKKARAFAVAVADTDNQTIARASGVDASALLIVATEHDATATTKAEGSADATSGATSLALSAGWTGDVSQASVGGAISAAGGVVVQANSDVETTSEAKAGANGAEPDAAASANQNVANAQNVAAQQSGRPNANAPQANTPDGSLSFAAAIAANVTGVQTRALVEGSAVLTTAAGLQVNTSHDVDASARADGSAVVKDGEDDDDQEPAPGTPDPSSKGIGVAVALNAATVANESAIRSGASVTAANVLVNAVTPNAEADSHTFRAEAISGAGAETTGFAGSLAINVSDNRSDAVIEAATVSAGAAGAVAVKAINISTSSAKATPAEDGLDADRTGIGASLAFNYSHNVTRADVDGALVMGTGRLPGADDVTVTATSRQNVTAEVESGNEGQDDPAQKSFAVSFALAIADNDVTARLAGGTSRTDPEARTTVADDLTVTATHVGKTTTKAEGGTDADKSSAGLVIAGNWADDDVTASLGGSVQVGGAADVMASSISESKVEGKAGVKGGDADDQVESTEAAANKAKAQANALTGTTNASPPAPKVPDGAVAKAGVLVLNVTLPTVVAQVEAGAVIDVNEDLLVRAAQNVRGDSIADASLVQEKPTTTGGGTPNVGDGSGVGGAIALNFADADVTAAIRQNADVEANGVRVEAGQIQPTERNPPLLVPADAHLIRATATSGAGVADEGTVGALAGNLLFSDVNAVVEANARVDVGNRDETDDLTVIADGSLASFTAATANVPGKTKKGQGLSVAANAAFSGTRATIEQGATVSGADDVIVEATSDPVTFANAEAGAQGKETDAPAFALIVAKHVTEAKMQPGPTVAADDVTVKATQNGFASSVATGLTAATESAFGASVAFTYAEDVVNAELDRDTAASDDVAVEAVNRPVDGARAVAGAAGTQLAGSTGAELTAKAKTFADTHGKTLIDRGFDTAKNNALNDAKNQIGNYTKSQGPSEGKAAAFAINAAVVNTRAAVGPDADVTAVGELVVRATSEVDSITEADGGAVNLNTSSGNNTALGIAVAAGYVAPTTEAVIGANARVIAGDVTVSAGHPEGDEHSVRVRALAGAGSLEGADAGALTFVLTDSQTRAFADQGASVRSNDDVLFDAAHEMRLQGIAGNVAAGTDPGKGGSGVLQSTAAETEAFVGRGASVDAQEEISLVAENVIAALDEDVPFDPMAAAVGAGVIPGDSAQQFSVVFGSISTDTRAFVDRDARLNQASGAAVASGAQQVTLTATDDVSAAYGSGAAAFGDVKGFGIGITFLAAQRDAEASIRDGAQVKAAGDVSLSADADLDAGVLAAQASLSLGADGAAQGGALAVLLPNSNVEASVGEGAVVAAANLAIAAVNEMELTVNADNLQAASQGDSVGVSGVLLFSDDRTTASVEDGAAVTVAGATGLTILASGEQTVLVNAVGAAVGGAEGVAPSFLISSIVAETTAFVGDGAVIEATNPSAGVNPSVALLATDETTLSGFAGGLSGVIGGGGSAGFGVGAGADAAFVTKTTQAYVAGGAVIDADQDVEVVARSLENVGSLAVALAVGGAKQVMGALSIYTLNVTTQAALGDDPNTQTPSAAPADVHAGGNVVVEADSRTNVDLLDGGGQFSNDQGFGGSASLPLVFETTEAYVGAGALVDADGRSDRSAASVQDGIEIEFFDPAFLPIDDNEVVAPDFTASFDDDPEAELLDPSLTSDRSATLNRRTFRGLAVTASNRASVETVAVAGGFGGQLAIDIAATLNVHSAKTSAFIGDGAVINADQSAAGPNQSVLVEASNDYAHLGISGLGAASGNAGFGPGAELAFVTNQTRAFIGAGADVSARRDVQVLANSSEDLTVVVAGLAAAGQISVAGSFALLKLDNETHAFVADGAAVDAGGDVEVTARDLTDTVVVTGAAGIGVGTTGVGASVGVLILDKDTQAFIGANADVTGRGVAPTTGGQFPGGGIGLPGDEEPADGIGDPSLRRPGVTVRAFSSEDVINVALAGSVSGLFAAAGGITITIVNSDTHAFVGAGADVNADLSGAASDQAVVISAENVVNALTVSGGLALGVGLGALSGGVDVGLIQNDTSARVDAGAAVAAMGDVDVLAKTSRTINGVAASIGGGALLGLAASVSVWTVGSELTATYDHDNDPATPPIDALRTETADPDNQGSGRFTADGFADSQAVKAHTRITPVLNAYQKSNFSIPGIEPAPTQRVGNAASVAAALIGQNAPTANDLRASLGRGPEAPDAPELPGTTAVLAAGSRVTAGGDVTVKAEDVIDASTLAGNLAAGLVGVGAGVNVLSVGTDTEAHVLGAVRAGGDVDVIARQTETLTATGLGGVGGLFSVGAAVTFVVDDSHQEASVGGLAKVEQADNLNVTAESDQTLSAFTGQAVVGLGAAVGLTFTIATALGSTEAHVGDDGTRFDEGGGPEEFPGGDPITFAEVGLAPGLSVGNVNVTADADVTVTADSVNVSGGIGDFSANFTKAEAFVEATAYVGSLADVIVTNDFVIRTTTDATAEADTLGLSLAGLAVGLNKSEAFASPALETRIGRAANVTAANDVRLQSQATTNANAHSVAANGALVGVVGAEANALAAPRALTLIDGGADVIAGADVLVDSRSTATSAGTADNSLVALFGTGQAVGRAHLNNSSRAEIGSAEVVAGDDVTVSSRAVQKGDSVAKSFGVAAIESSHAEVGTDVRYESVARLGAGADVTAGDVFTLDATGRSDGNATADADGAGLTGAKFAAATVRVHAYDDPGIAGTPPLTAPAQVLAQIGTGSDVTARAAQVRATVERPPSAAGDPAAFRGHLAHTSARAHSTVAAGEIDVYTSTDVYTQALVDVQGGAEVVAPDEITLESMHEQLGTSMFASAELDGAAGATDLNLTHNQHSQTLVTAARFAELTTRDLTVRADLDSVEYLNLAEVEKAFIDFGETNVTATLSPRREILWDATVRVPAEASPELVIETDAAGNAVVTKAVNVTINDPDGPHGLPGVLGPVSTPQIVVNPILNDELGTVLFEVPTVSLAGVPSAVTRLNTQGTVDGQRGVFVYDRTFDAVTIINTSARDVVLNVIDVISDAEPVITVRAERTFPPINPATERHGFDVLHTYDPTVIDVRSGLPKELFLSGATPDVIVGGSISNPVGQTHLRANHGDVISQGRRIETGLIDVRAGGDVGSASQRLGIDLVHSAEQPATLEARAGDDLFLDVRAHLRQVLPNNAPFVVAAPVIQAGDDADVTFQQTRVQNSQPGFGAPTALVVEDLPGTGNDRQTTVLRSFRPFSEESVTLPLGVFGTGTGGAATTYDVGLLDVDGSVTLTDLSTTTPNNLDLTTALGPNSQLTATSVGGLSVAQAGALHSATLRGDVVTLGASGGLGSATAPLLIDSNRLSIAAGGDVFVKETAGNLNVDLISTTGDVSLEAAAGSILDALNDAAADVIGIDVTLKASAGIGSTNNDVETAVNGELMLTAGLSAFVQERDGSLTVRQATTPNGVLRLSVADAAGAGQDLIVAPGGNVSAPGAIVLQGGDDVVIGTGATVASGLTVSVAVDSGNQDAGLGGAATVNGAVAGTQVDFTGNADADSFTFSDWSGNARVNGAAGSDGLTLGLAGGTVTTLESMRLSGITTSPSATSSVVNGSLSVSGVVGAVVADGPAAQDLIVNAALSGSGGLVKQGAGVLSLNGTNANTGLTTLEAGTLGGTGQSGPLTASGGLINPGNGGPGTLMVNGDLNLTTRGGLFVEINGTASRDVLSVRGAVTLGGALTGKLGFASAVGNQYLIINNDGFADPVVGRFSNEVDGFVILDRVRFAVNYRGGDGNDVVLTHVNTNSAMANRAVTTPIDEGGVAVVTGNPTDPDPLDVFILFVDWKDGSAVERYEFPAGTQSVAVAHKYRDNGVYVIGLQWLDQHGGGNRNTLTVVVNNVAPTLDLDGPDGGVRGQARALVLAASDASSVDQAGTFRYDVNWGDGSSETFFGPARLEVSHAYVSAGSFVVRATATDKDGGVSTGAAHALTINAVELQAGTLAVGGTDRDDVIVIEPADLDGGLRVQINGVDQGTFRPTAGLLVFGQGGDDVIALESARFGKKEATVGVRAVLDGGDGDDWLSASGSRTANVLLGRGGDDVLIGGRGRDLLIGGAGRDVLYGAGEEDLLIGGGTRHDDDLTALDAILAEWARTDRPLAQRQKHLTGKKDGGLNGEYLLDDAALIGDGVCDVLFGSAGRDWLLLQEEDVMS